MVNFVTFGFRVSTILGFVALGLLAGCGSGASSTGRDELAAVAGNSVFTNNSLVEILKTEPRAMTKLFEVAAGESGSFYQNLLAGTSNAPLVVNGQEVFGVKTLLQHFNAPISAYTQSYPTLKELWQVEGVTIERTPSLQAVAAEVGSMSSWYKDRASSAGLSNNSAAASADESLVNLVALSFLQALSHLPESALAAAIHAPAQPALALNWLDGAGCVFSCLFGSDYSESGPTDTVHNTFNSYSTWTWYKNGDYGN